MEANSYLSIAGKFSNAALIPYNWAHDLTKDDGSLNNSPHLGTALKATMVAVSAIALLIASPLGLIASPLALIKDGITFCWHKGMYSWKGDDNHLFNADHAATRFIGELADFGTLLLTVSVVAMSAFLGGIALSAAAPAAAVVLFGIPAATALSLGSLALTAYSFKHLQWERQKHKKIKKPRGDVKLTDVQRV